MWLYDALEHKFSKSAKAAINSDDLFVSPMVVLELTYLKEINRLNPTPAEVLSFLEESVDLKRTAPNFETLINTAVEIRWTRDPFDRIITAEAAMNDSLLVTADEIILKNYPKAVW